MEKRDVWFLEMDNILIPLDRVYRIGKNYDIDIPVDRIENFQVDINHINATLRFVSSNVEDNHSVVYMPENIDEPFIMSCYKDNPILLNGKLILTSFLMENDVLKIDGYGKTNFKKPFIVKKKSPLQKDGLKAMLVGAVDQKNIPGYENSVHAFRGTLLDKGARPENIQTYLDYDAQRFNIRDGLERLIDGSNYSDTTFFYFNGHGDEKGIYLSGYDSLDTNSFYKLFNQIKGKNVVVVDCCNSKNFVEGLDSSAYFFGASIRMAYSQEYQFNLGNFTRLFLQMINKKDFIDLADIREDDINSKLSALNSTDDVRAQRVYFKGPSLYL
jgi:hypothetical protein